MTPALAEVCISEIALPMMYRMPYLLSLKDQERVYALFNTRIRATDPHSGCCPSTVDGCRLGLRDDSNPSSQGLGECSVEQWQTSHLKRSGVLTLAFTLQEIETKLDSDQRKDRYSFNSYKGVANRYVREYNLWIIRKAFKEICEACSVSLQTATGEVSTIYSLPRGRLGK